MVLQDDVFVKNLGNTSKIPVLFGILPIIPPLPSKGNIFFLCI